MIVDVSDLSRQKSNWKATTKSQVYFPRLLVLIFCDRFGTAGAPRSPPLLHPNMHYWPPSLSQECLCSRPISVYRCSDESYEINIYLRDYCEPSSITLPSLFTVRSRLRDVSLTELRAGGTTSSLKTLSVWSSLSEIAGR